MEPSSPAARPVVVLAYDGIGADEAGLVVSILTGAGVPVTIATVAAPAVTSYHGRVAVDRRVADLSRCRALIVPGGMGVRRAAGDDRLLAAIRRLAAEATWLGATSTGSVLLASAGVIDGSRATTHWLAGDLLTSRGIELVRHGFVEHGRLLTASGTATAPELAFRLIGALVGVGAEAEARDAFKPGPSPDPRYQRVRRRWFERLRSRLGGARSADPIALDPTGQAEIVFLDLTELDADDGSDADPAAT